MSGYISPLNITIQDEGVLQGVVQYLNFAGTNVSVSVSNGVATITISGGSGVTSIPLTAYAALGSSIKAEPVGFSMTQLSTGYALATQTFFIVPVYVVTAATITGVKWLQNTQGNYTSNNYNGVGLYTYSGGTLTLVASSTDDGAIWKAASNSWGTKAFSATYSASAGLYFIGGLYNRSAEVAAPILGSTVASFAFNAALGDFTNSAKLFGTVGSITAGLPATQAMLGVSALSNHPYLVLY